MDNTENARKPRGAFADKLLTALGVILCIILIPILVMNATLVAQGYIEPEKVPDVLGTSPLVVLSNSMYPVLEAGDLIFVRETEADSVRVGDVISFFDPVSSGTAVVTHRVAAITEVDGVLAFETRGDNNNADDLEPVTADRLVGVYRMRVPKLGNFFMFLQTTTGLVVCVFVPLVLLMAYDLLRRRAYEKNKQSDTEAMLAELQALKAERAKTVPAEPVPDEPA